MQADEDQISFQRHWRGKGFRLGARSKRALRVAIEALIEEHMSGRHDRGKKLWALYTLFSVTGRRPIT
jgi:hypothetical protein